MSNRDSYTLFERILASRGLGGERLEAFLHPDYASGHDPFLLPDMELAVERLVAARGAQEKIMIYGDYDIDGLTATTLLLDALESFGFTHVEAFIPNRFVEGYGMTIDAVERIAATGATLILTVDCGSLSHGPIARAAELGVDVIVTDHHNVATEQPPAVAVINPKRLLADYPEMYDQFILNIASPISSASAQSLSGTVSSSQDKSTADSLQSAELGDSLKQSSTGQESAVDLSGFTKAPDKNRAETPQPQPSSESLSNSVPSTTYRLPLTKLYPFLDLPGVGVAFKLVQALQTRLDGLPIGREKWLLDLVALGTVCDVVTLKRENRTHVYWGLQVLERTRRPGLKALMAVARVDPRALDARSLGFALGPRMNAAGRLETAQLALDMLRETEPMEALEKARQLDDMNQARRAEQDKIFKDALVQAEQRSADNVLVVSQAGWNHGIVGIVAAKLLERFGKPTYVLSEMGEDAKGSARSYGDFSAADAIRAADDIVTSGGGHMLAAGVTLPSTNIADFRKRVNAHYDEKSLVLSEQQAKLLPRADATARIGEVTEQLVAQLATLEPYGKGNEQPVVRSEKLMVKRVRRMGADNQHVKLTLADSQDEMDFLAFSAPEYFYVEPGETIDVWYQPSINEWQGRRSVEGRLLHLTLDGTGQN